MTSPRRRTARLLAVVAGVAAASIALTGCLFSPIPDRTQSSATSRPADTDGIAEDLLPFYEQDLEWSDCGGFDCTMVTAPLDWEDPELGEIELSVIRQRATDGDAIGSLLTNPGGPGASGVDLIRQSLDFAVGEVLPASYDIIGFDPRGVGESTAVRCYDAAQMDAYLFDIPPGTRGSAEWNADLVAGEQAFAQACQANSGGILEYVTTTQSARDLDLLRGVLGDAKLNYLGYSYGTFLGATYAKLFPERVGRLVLDGALDPSVSESDVSTTQAIGFENALRTYMASCLADSGCPFAGSVDDAMADLGTLLARVDRSPIRNTDGRMLGADALLTAIVAALYSESSWSYLTAALAGAAQGDAVTAFELADFYYNRSDGVYLDNSTEAFTAYNCMDYPTETPEEQAAASAILAAQAPIVAPYWESDVDGCASWPFPPTGVRETITADGAAPIVVIGTTGDPATPYDWAVSLADQLSSGVLITRVGEGHTGYNKGNTCVDSAVEAYLLDGTVPEDGLRCE
ncbi:MAG: alpha/beta hydrolase [Microbacterium sp.]|uniref:alpha/beta hydrolase n=1 Tax=Microbacterium sp. TaxID=51671 RepID=UPI00262E6315|nr:alpha/beta hydrolase [Microbacterium sp.]MCX6502730.1 alpha/beta hydrolase [Microbacterium sp.]